MDLTAMAKGERRDGERKVRSEVRLQNKKNIVRDMHQEEHLYVPPQPSDLRLEAVQVETHNPAQPFTLASCQICGIPLCGVESPGHETQIIIAVSSKGRSPTACAVFCNIESPYNKTYLLHGSELNRQKKYLRAVIEE